MQIISGPLEGVTLSLHEDQEISLGRGAQNNIILGFDPCLSTNHAVIKRQSGKLKVLDLNSSNGTFMDGKKIQPNNFYYLNDYFVLGSTVFHCGEVIAVKESGPLPFGQFHPSQEWSGLYQKAVDFSKSCQHGVINTGHLFWALCEQFPEDSDSFFGRTKILPKDLRDRWSKAMFFDLGLRWLNDFLRFQLTTVPVHAPLVSPKVQHFFRTFALKKASDFKSMLELLVADKGGIIFHMLDWEKSKEKWSAATSLRKTKTPTGVASPYRQQVFPDRLWKDLTQLVMQNKLLVLAGSKGCGKTSIMHRIFHPITDFKLASSFNSEPILFDSKVFLVFNEANQLSFYLERIVEALGQHGLVGIDHFAHLLQVMQEERYDRGPLIQAIRERKAHLILTLNEENVEMIKGLFHGTFLLDLDKYIEEVRTDIYAHILKQFEHRVKCLVSPRAKEFFMEFIVKPAPSNFAAMEDFLALCASQSHGIDFPFQELSQETRSSGLLGRNFFRDIYDEWVGRTRTSTNRQIIVPKESAKSLGETKAMLDLLLQLETLIQTFVKNEFKVSLYYSDQTRSLEDERYLTRNQKIEELKTQLVVLLTSYQSSFEKWFETFWGRVGPEAIKANPSSGGSAKKLWEEYVNRAGLIDAPYAVDHFHEIAARIFMEVWRSKKTETRV